MRRAVVILALVALLVPAIAGACAVCGAGINDRNANAFAGTTALLSLLPLGMFGGCIWWLRKNGYGDGEFLDRDEPRDGDEEGGT
jgi:high-affinity Fe2+/Pb2+ permease